MQQLEPEPHKKIKLDMRKPLTFNILKTYNTARASILNLPHGDVKTPVYMPVGTKGAMKGVTYQEMKDMHCKLLLGNTYHLAYRPGAKILQQVGGLHNFTGWDYNFLTDSGGFQMVSLSKLCEVTENGVSFESPYDQTMMHLRPEDSIKMQNIIGGDIIMALDDVVRTTTEGPRMQEASDRTIRWLDRNIDAHDRKHDQNLFPIIQGGIDPELRKQCLEAMIKKDANGYAIGGLAGGEDKVYKPMFIQLFFQNDFWKTVHLCCQILPQNKPRYLMGVGYPVDIVVSACLGVDMFDCVFSTRTARFGTAFTDFGFLKLKNKDSEDQFIPIQEGCQCQACLQYTRSFLHFTVGKEETASHLISIHNLHWLIDLMLKMHQAIIDEKLPEFVNQFLQRWFHTEKVIPQWVINALQETKIKVQVQF